MSTKTRYVLVGLLILFAAVRLPGLSTPYHQDEFKTVRAAEAGLTEASAFLTHPPLTAVLLHADLQVFGADRMRVLPLLFAVLGAALLFLTVRRRAGEAAALWALFLYAVSFYGVWASLMLDTDGAILPALLLAAFYCYDRARSASGRGRAFWAGCFVLALVVGLLVKLSFVLVAGAAAADFLFEKRHELDARRLARFGIIAAGILALCAAAFAFVKVIDPAFDLRGMITHALYYVRFSGRSYLQILIQSIKALFYLSPLLIVPLLFASKETVRKNALFFWYLGAGFVFYFILFDFSLGALDKYLMFTIVPLCAIGGTVLSERLSLRLVRRTHVALGALLAALLFALVSVTPDVVPLYPKTLWFSRVLAGDWNVLTPFNGGSGPVGFYMSFLTIACGFLAAGAVALAGRVRPALITGSLVIVLCIGVAYNAVFIEEFSFGKAYGSAETVLDRSVAYLSSSAADDITRVNTHYDIGAYELKRIGKYDGSHFTAAPQFEAAARALFPTFEGAFLVVDMPALYDGFYREFFESCRIRFTARSGFITSTVYDSCTWTKG